MAQHSNCWVWLRRFLQNSLVILFLEIKFWLEKVQNSKRTSMFDIFWFLWSEFCIPKSSEFFKNICIIPKKNPLRKVDDNCSNWMHSLLKNHMASWCINSKILKGGKLQIEIHATLITWCSLNAKLYTPSTLNMNLILWHTHLIVCAVK